jgi:peptidyl-prolyl cis-trans isomerase C
MLGSEILGREYRLRGFEKEASTLDNLHKLQSLVYALAQDSDRSCGAASCCYPIRMRAFYLLLSSPALLVWAQPTPAPAPDPVVLTIGNERITKSQFEQILATLPDAQRAVGQTPDGRRRVAEQLVELKTLAQEARARKLDEIPVVKMKIALGSDQVLASTVYSELAVKTTDEAALRAYYDAHKQEWEEVKARHILIRMTGSRAPARPGQKDLTDEEALAKAKDLRAKIVAGASFGDLAKTESDDPGSGEQGGELGSFGHGNMVAEFEEAAFSIPIGQVSEPVKTVFGYHLILVDARTAKSFEDVQAEVAKKVQPDVAQRSVEELKKKNPARYDETYFGKEGPAK